MTKFQIERVKYMISQAEKQTYVNLNKGDAEILKTLLEPNKEKSEFGPLILVEEPDKLGTFEEMLDKVSKGDKL